MRTAAILIVLAALLVGASAVSADTPYPKDVQVFELGDGHTCVVWPDGSGDCYCACSCQQAPQATEKLQDKPKDKPQATATPFVPDEPTPTEPPHKERCNKGGGNGSEGCDPGNHPELGHDDE